MKVIETIEELKIVLGEARRQGRNVEFVPTMGALHQGHASLINRAKESPSGEGKREGACVVVSIFVNPTQFGPDEDYASYPRDPDGDRANLQSQGVDVLFAPSVAAMYPNGEIATTVSPGRIAEVAEGRWRPGHFAGVATVCAKLFNIVQPDRVYFGEKDAQQVAVLRQMVADLNMPTEIVTCPTVREADGLALSSRNRRLDPQGRQAATVLPAALLAVRTLVERGEKSSEALVAQAREIIARQPRISLQYLEVVDPRTFEPVEHLTAGSLLILAALVGSVRLIDNIQLS